MFDALFISMLGWCSVRGWYKGPARMVIDLLTTILVFRFMAKASVWLKDLVSSPEKIEAFRAWVAGHIRSVPPASAVYEHWNFSMPVGLGLSQTGTIIAQNIYITFFTLLLGVVTVTGIQLVMTGTREIWSVRPRLTSKERLLGVMAGIGLGMYINYWILSAVGWATWFVGFEWLDAALSNSLFVKIFLIPL